jgi:hypothetical protein
LAEQAGNLYKAQMMLVEAANAMGQSGEYFEQGVFLMNKIGIISFKG